MQMGMLTKSTKTRLDDLETQKEQIELSILSEKAKKDSITRKDIISWLKKMKSVDLSVDVKKRHFVDKYINSVITMDDKLIIYFNLRENATIPNIMEIKCSDVYGLGEPS